MSSRRDSRVKHELKTKQEKDSHIRRNLRADVQKNVNDCCNKECVCVDLVGCVL